MEDAVLEIAPAGPPETLRSLGSAGTARSSHPYAPNHRPLVGVRVQVHRSRVQEVLALVLQSST